MVTAVSSGKCQFPPSPSGDQLPYWVEIQLVDELGSPVANMPWKAESHHPTSGHIKQFTYSGQSDAEGHIRVDMPHGLELRLTLDADLLAKEMEKRSLRVGRDAFNDSEVRLKTEECGNLWHYAVIGELCQTAPSVELKDGETLPSFHFPPGKAFKGFLFRTNELEKKHVIEICPFRAWELVLHHQNDYSMANAVNLGELADLAYDEIDSITDFFNAQCLDLSKLPTRKMGDLSVNALVCDVPFSNRYFTPVSMDSARVDNPEGDTQLFYVYNNDKIIVAWRGTASITDGITDASFRPVTPQSCDKKMQCASLTPAGKVHTGFWEGYDVIEKRFKEQLKDLLKNIEGRMLFICGHSLGGSLALIQSAKLKNSNPVLYTYGMPRTFTKDAVEQLSGVIHFRHVNDQDPVPAVPPEANVDNMFYDLWGPIGTVFGGLWSTVELAAWKVVEWGDCFWHHGNPVVFLTTTQSRKWQRCGIEYPYPRNCMTIKNRLPLKVKLYLVPSLAEQEAQDAGKSQREFKTTLTKDDMKEFFPDGTNSSRGVALNILNHLMTSYLPYINNKLLELIDSQELSKSKHFTEHADNINKFRLQMSENISDIPKDEFKRNEFFLSLENLLNHSLKTTISMVSGSDTLERFGKYGEEDIENV